MKGPPSGVSPAKLFLQQAEWRPRRRLAARAHAARDVELWAQAVPSVELQRCECAVDAACLVIVDSDRNRVFTPETAGLLLPDEWSTIEREAALALDEMCPTFGRSDVAAWEDALAIGLRSQLVIRAQLVASFDVLIGKKPVFLQRPDRFFGKPLCEVLDGHLMVFAAVRDYLNKLYK